MRTARKKIGGARLVLSLLAGVRLSYADTTLVTAANFGVLGASTVTDTGPSVISGDLGLYSGLSITGYPPGIVNGTTYEGDDHAMAAQADALAAYNALAGMAPDDNLTGQDLG